MEFREISAETLNKNVFDLIGKSWMIINAKDGEKSNGMTASWGGMGVAFGKNVCYIMVRPSRHTYGFIEKNGAVSLNFFDEKYRAALNLYGSKSGRDVNKEELSGLTIQKDGAFDYYNEASLVICAKKICKTELDKDSFFDDAINLKFFKDGDYHTLYICEIEKILTK